MPNRLSKILSRSTKEKEAEAEAERSNSNGSSPPPGYAAQPPPDYNEDNQIDPPDITAGFNNLSLNSANSDTPQVDQCIAHLKVLECFYRLRQKIGSTDGLFGIENNFALDKGLSSEDKTPEVLAKFAEKRWAVYVSRAVERFEKWSATIIPEAQMARNSDLEMIGKEGKLCDPINSKASLKFDKNNMPPADVLMVWHAYMLNPRAYLEDCLRLGRMKPWHIGMPWQAAIDCINSETFAYEAGEEAAKNFTSDVNLPWENLDDAGPKRVGCPGCKANVEVPWTTCADFAIKIERNLPWNSFVNAVDEMLASGQGYCDKDFWISCRSCYASVSHESLKTSKFCNDLKTLLFDDVPMGGTVLGIDGIPWKFSSVSDPLCAQICKFPALLFRAGLGKKILDEFRDNSGEKRMTDIRRKIEDSITSRTYIRQVKGLGGRMQRMERIGIRRMMSRYWENSSPFALDLVGAVVRQGSFIEKMHNIDWIHSPALPSTMKRLLVKYQRFISIMSDKRNMAVPTLDVDLAWHTHQLSPFAYMTYTVEATKQFIDHDDKVAETILNDAFAWTSKTYQKLYGERYSECTCWYCEAVRESNTNAASRLFKTKNTQVNEQLHDIDQDPRKSVHISAHNAVRPRGDDYNYKRDETHKRDDLEKQYQKACERARKKGRKEPRRDDYYYSDGKSCGYRT